MSLLSRVALPALLTGAFIYPAMSEETEVKLTEAQLPAAVKATMEKEAKGATLSDFEKETKKGKVVYTAEIPGATKNSVTEFTVAEDGTLISSETEKDDGDQKGEHDNDEHNGEKK